MISQHQFQRMRVQVDLIHDILRPEFPHIMIYQRDRDHQGYKSVVVTFDDFLQFGFLVRIQIFFEVPHDVHEHVRILLDRRYLLKRGGKGAQVTVI